tara:strand:- start:714 stop:854 length:141 start_codon:yes stop_codon:yes gene_type:complete
MNGAIKLSFEVAEFNHKSKKKSKTDSKGNKVLCESSLVKIYGNKNN